MPTKFLFFIGAAVVLGMIHSIEPGHGKTVIAAYLIGTEGKVRDALFLGLIVTFSHTFIVILIAIIALLASSFLVTETISEILHVVSGLLIIAVGIWMFSKRNEWHTHSHKHIKIGKPEKISTMRLPGSCCITDGGGKPGENCCINRKTKEDHRHEHYHEEDHDYEEHMHVLGEEKEDFARIGDKRSLFSLGVSGGIVPCPAAIAILLVAVSSSKFLEGLFVILVFSIGLATALIFIGIVACKASSKLRKWCITDNATRLIKLRMISSLIVITLGIYFVISGLLLHTGH